jgi:hypothetical protein
MIRPARFGYNPETQGTNAFQAELRLDAGDIQGLAAVEFDGVVETLQNAGVNVLLFDDTPEPEKPDAVFPNNWVSFHDNGTVVLYPMFAEARRNERRMDILEILSREFQVNEVIDLSGYETGKCFLEGTGSIVFDHPHCLAYACLSARTDEALLNDLCERLDYHAVVFSSIDREHRPIYHTNVMMCIADRFSAICMESIADKQERQTVFDSLTRTGHEVINISFEQMYKFAGNMLAVRTQDGRDMLAMSDRAFKSLTALQVRAIEKYCEIIPVGIPTIETVGGGSARCMMAEVFLPRKQYGKRVL